MIVALASYMDKGAVAIFAAALGGGCLGFLVFNFPPARIFLGDTGSLFIGMLLGELAIDGRGVEVTAVRRRNIRALEPTAETRFEADDVVVLLGVPGALATAESRLLKG